MKFNICLVRPKGYIHSDAFLELAQVIAYSLEDLGHQASIQYHAIEKSAKNIILGCHLLDPKYQDSIPKDSIIINTEQLFSEASPWSGKWTETIFAWANRFETWDYSERNIDYFSRIGVEGVKYLRLGYHSKLARIEKSEDQDIDVLFYGSINLRRQKILNDMRREGLCVKSVSGLYGSSRDALISRSKVVLNLHYYNSQIFEVIRVFYLLANRVAVVSEVNQETSIDPSFLAGIRCAPYDGLVSACVDLVGNMSVRSEQEAKAKEFIEKISQREIIRSLV